MSVYSLNHVRPEPLERGQFTLWRALALRITKTFVTFFFFPVFPGRGVRVQPEPCAPGTAGARTVHAVARPVRPLRLARGIRRFLRFHRHRSHAGKHLKGLCNEIGKFLGTVPYKLNQYRYRYLLSFALMGFRIVVQLTVAIKYCELFASSVKFFYLIQKIYPGILFRDPEAVILILKTLPEIPCGSENYIFFLPQYHNKLQSHRVVIDLEKL